MIELLVDRLRWPAALVRERAASQIGNLIVDGDQDICDTLLAWIDRQELESLAAIGLLPFLHAAARAGARPLTTDELASACRARSVLFELYLSHLDPSHVTRLGLGRHSGSPPSEWQAPDKVPKVSDSPLEALLRDQLRMIERRFLSSLTRQFDFEVSVLYEQHGRSPIQAFWAAGTKEQGYHPGWQPLASEVCLSAYLRTLAWAASNESLPTDLILAKAAIVSPVDLALWGVQPTVSPNWWPSLETGSGQGEVDKETVMVLRNVNGAVGSWNSRSMSFSLRADASLRRTSGNTTWRSAPSSSDLMARIDRQARSCSNISTQSRHRFIRSCRLSGSREQLLLIQTLSVSPTGSSFHVPAQLIQRCPSHGKHGEVCDGSNALRVP